jgi:heme/copper-type cytochrome/quinol oxidase subunit 3
MTGQIPFADTVRPDTGFSNGQLAMWLFLASEVMLFGGLFSSYVILRTGSPDWPDGGLSVAPAAANTIILLASSLTMARAAAASRHDPSGRYRTLLAISIGLGVLFLAIKGYEYAGHIAHGELPSVNNALAMYFTLTGFHALHILGGLVAMSYLAGPGSALRRTNPALFANRLDNTTLYWHFVDVVWLCLFVTLYLV